MSQLKTFQSNFAAALRGDTQAAAQTENQILTDRVPPNVRLGIYQSSVANSLADVLGTAFPATARMMSPARFDSIARRFAAAFPPPEPVLVRYGAAFPDFLVEHYHWPEAAVARLEWARIEALHAAEAAPLGHAALEIIPDDRLGDLVLVPHPSLRLLRDDSAFVSAWLAYRPEGDGAFKAKDQTTGPEAALVLREGNLVAVSYLKLPMHRFLSTLSLGLTLTEAVEAAGAIDADFDVLAALHFAFSQGLFTAVKL